MFDADHGREMVNEIDFRDQAVDQLEVEDRIVHVMKARIVQQVTHLGDRAGVEHKDLVAARDEGVRKM
jgi:hypothetical protein